MKYRLSTSSSVVGSDAKSERSVEVEQMLAFAAPRETEDGMYC